MMSKEDAQRIVQLYGVIGSIEQALTDLEDGEENIDINFSSLKNSPCSGMDLNMAIPRWRVQDFLNTFIEDYKAEIQGISERSL